MRRRANPNPVSQSQTLTRLSLLNGTGIKTVTKRDAVHTCLISTLQVWMNMILCTAMWSATNNLIESPLYAAFSSVLTEFQVTLMTAQWI